jgi:Na+/melibiose symporter-like transporter
VAKEPIKQNNRDYFKSLMSILRKDKNFVIYLTSTAFVGGLGKMSLAFQIIYAKDKLSITTADAVTLSVLLLVTQTIGYALWGIVVSKKGLKLAGTLSGLLFIPAIILTLWMPNTWVLYAAVTFMSLAQSYRNSNENKLVINLAPDHEVLPSYIGLRNTMMGPFFSFNSLLGGLILSIWNFTVLSVASLIFMTAGMLLFALKLKVPEV